MDWQDDLKRRRRFARLLRVARWLVTSLIAFNAFLLVVLVLVFVVPLPHRDATPSVVVEYRDGRPAYVFLTADEKWRLPVTLDRVDPKYVEALVALEDKRFWSHDGVDTNAMARAAVSNVTHLRRVTGGSTLTMQLARLLEPRKRTVKNKLIDMFRATQLDMRMSKREILEQYLTLTPYGGNVEGIESAAWSYFGHSAKSLTPLEIATLLAVPQGPSRFAPKPQNTARLRARRDKILEKLITAGVFTGSAVEVARADAQMPPPDKRLRMPREAPHAAWLLARKHKGQTQIRSTLDRGAQLLVEKEVRLRTPELRTKGIYSGAVVVVDHRTREVVALVGSLDFADSQHGGQIAMFARPRSPGSTLKPFLYALAIDHGNALPGYLVPDVPTQYGTYRPKNFDGDWAGLVRLEDALSKSLNIPFVDLLQTYGVEPFLHELGRMGMSMSRLEPGKYGLSMIIGGIEVTPLELASMYATLAEDGAYKPIKLTAGSDDVPALQIFGPGAAWLTKHTLSIKDRPDFPRRRLSGMPADIHWKTGTSFGFKDAWAVGSNPAYTAVVWTGNVDNTPTAELVGSEAAGPLLFDVLEGLADRARGISVPATPPADLVEIDVCTYSGYPATDACPARSKALAPVHAVPTAVDPYHQAYDVDPRTKRAVLPGCRTPGVAYERKTFIVLPSAVAAWLGERNRAVPEAPVFADNCVPDTVATVAPTMLTPVDGQVVTLIPGVPTKNQLIPLTASTRSSTVSWFVDGELIGTSRASDRLYWEPSPGKHEVVVADATGRKSRRQVTVEAVR
jgi:penicillin-binding protein 1C